ncbi:hypothetical protein Tco_0827247 [Tanacetum coccineum]
MENANPPPTSNRPILPAVLCVQAVQELHERQRISAFIDSRLESSERFLTNFANQPNETNMNDPESNDESVDTLLVSPFPHSDNDSDEVLSSDLTNKIAYRKFLTKNEEEFFTVPGEGVEIKPDGIASPTM